MSLNPRKIWTLSAIWALAIFGLSSIPGNRIPSIPVSNIDKFAHTAVYSVLGALCCLALRLSTRLRKAALVAWTVGLATLYGVSDEVHQLFVHGRSSDVHDVMADALGGLLGALTMQLLVSRWLVDRQLQE